MEEAKNSETNTPEVPEKGTREETAPRAVQPGSADAPNQLEEDAEELEDRLERDLGDSGEDEAP